MSKWMVPADELDAEQKHFLYNILPEKTNQWIKGFPGSGKSVLLMHALADAVQSNPGAKILVIYFTHSLQQMYIAGLAELKIDSTCINYATYLSFEKNYNENNRYNYIFCDEVQDLTKSALEKMRKSATYLFVSGDPNQSIFANNPKTQEPTIAIEDIGTATNAAEFELTTIHRLTKSIVNLIDKLLPNMRILASKTNAKKRDVTTRIGAFANQNDEVSYIMAKAKEALDINETVAIILPTHKDIMRFASIHAAQQNYPQWEEELNRYNKPDFDKFNGHYQKINMYYIGNGYGSLAQAAKTHSVILITYHSAKGLDFDEVFLPFLTTSASLNNESIFMVGVSRSKQSLTFSYTGRMHQYLSKIKDQCHEINTSPSDDFYDEDIPF